jgi:hypothetical protein
LSEATIDDDVLSGDVGGPVAGEQKHDVGDLLGGGESLSRVLKIGF